MPHYDCIVLGAGIAGVTAARNLQKENLAVLLIEGSDRIGGRMYTKHGFIKRQGADAAKFPIEAGAEYIHVAKTDRYREFWDELEHHGFTARRFQKYPQLGWQGKNRVTFPDWGGLKNLIDTMFDNCPELWQMKDLLDEIMDFNPAHDRPGAREYVDAKGYWGKGHTMARYAISAHTPGILDDNRDTISVPGLKADEIPQQLLETAEYRMEDANGEICGYDQLPKRIAAEFENPGGGVPGTILLDHEVTRVERIGQGLKVTTGNGDTFTGTAVICTFSVGMLDPDTGLGDAILGGLLTPAKRDALGIVKMGPITKFGLEFDRCVWNDDVEMSVLSSPTTEARTFFSAFPGRRDGPFVLTGLLMGTDHERIKDLDDEQAIGFFYSTVQSIFNPRRPGDEASWRRWKRSRVLVGESRNGRFHPNFSRQDWGRDHFARGGNSYISNNPAGAIPVEQVREALKSPLDTLPLFWAGEATAPAYNRDYQPLAVHGAYISGVEVAKDVAQYIRGGMNQPAFAGWYRQKYDPAVFAAPRVVAPGAQVTITLNADQLEKVRKYALVNTGGDIDRAVAELVRFTVRTWL